MKINQNLAAVHAYLCADGYVIKNPDTQKHKYYRIGLRNTDIILLKDYQNRFENIFKIKTQLIEGQRSMVGSKEIYERLTKQFGSFYSWEWKMPEMDNNSLKIWLRAYFDCEGWVTCKSHKNRVIGADCVNRPGLYQVKNALEKLGIKSRIKKRNTRNIYSLKIYGKENLMRYQKIINFLHPLKKERLNIAVNDFIDYEWKFPNNENELKEFIINILKMKAKIKKGNGVIRIISNLEINLTRLQKELYRLFGIEPKVNKVINGVGTVYFELNINKQVQVKSLIDKNLISEEEKEKWIIWKLKK